MDTPAASRVYHDLVDEPRVGSAILLTSNEDRRLKWRGMSVESCLRSFLQPNNTEDYLFRRVDPETAFLLVWEIPTPVINGGHISGEPGRLLGGYDLVSSFKRTIKISPVLTKRFGVREVYLLSDEIASQFSYLDTTGKIRPINLVVDGTAIDPEPDEDFLRSEVEAAIPSALEQVYPYMRD